MGRLVRTRAIEDELVVSRPRRISGRVLHIARKIVG
jgi:hypothetical protein